MPAYWQHQQRCQWGWGKFHKASPQDEELQASNVFEEKMSKFSPGTSSWRCVSQFQVANPKHTHMKRNSKLRGPTLGVKKTHWVKALYLKWTQAWRPEFDTWYPHSKRRQQIPARCPLTFSHERAMVCTHTHTQSRCSPTWQFKESLSFLC